MVGQVLYSSWNGKTYRQRRWWLKETNPQLELHRTFRLEKAKTFVEKDMKEDGPGSNTQNISQLTVFKVIWVQDSGEVVGLGSFIRVILFFISVQAVSHGRGEESGNDLLLFHDRQ